MFARGGGRGTGFSREGGVSDDPLSVTVPAFSRLKPVPRHRFNIEITAPGEFICGNRNTIANSFVPVAGTT